MNVLTLPKGQSWIKEGKTCLFKGGEWAGSYGVELSMSGNLTGRPDTTAEVIRLVLALPLPGTKLIRICGNITPQDDQIYYLIKALRQYGFSVQAIVRSDSGLMPWFTEVSYLTVHTTNTFIPFACEEIWYEPDTEKVDPIATELIFPTVKPTFLFLKNVKDMEWVEKFITNSKYHWRVTF